MRIAGFNSDDVVELPDAPPAPAKKKPAKQAKKNPNTRTAGSTDKPKE